MKMTIAEIIKCYKYRMKKIEDEHEFNNRRTARICMILANINRDKKKKITPFKEDDFIPKKKLKNKKPMSVNEMALVLQTITLAYNGNVVE